MSDFEIRFERAVRRIREVGTPTNRGDLVFPRQEMFARPGRHIDRVMQLRDAFCAHPFIYGTAGKKALQYKGRGNPATAALKAWHAKTARSVLTGKADAKGRPRAAPQSVEEWGKYENLTRALRLYDPGPRTEQYIKRGYQMMDCYFGMDNWLHTLRVPIIAEFVHYAMDFMGPFDMDVSGLVMAQRTFPGEGDNWGWKTAEIEARYNGNSTTKEISKIIREAIHRWGGLIVFEGKAVYGASIFNPDAYSGDTDKEAQELFKSFSRGSGPRVPYGRGYVEFQWGGVPTVPSRAHFLTNWLHRDDGLVHTYLNRVEDETLDVLFGGSHGLHDIWNNFTDFPTDVNGFSLRDKAAYIQMLGELTSYAYGSGRRRVIKGPDPFQSPLGMNVSADY